MFKNYRIAAALAAFLALLPVGSKADPTVTTNPGQRYVTIQTYWSNMTAADRQRIVSQAVSYAMNQVEQKAPLLKSPTLDSMLLSPALMNDLTTVLQRYLDDTYELESSKSKWKNALGDILPHAFLFTVGGDFNFSWGIGGGGSVDLGIVVMLPSYETVIDTAQRDSQGNPLIISNDKIKWFDASIVGIPHGFLALGYGGGLTFSVGIAGIWSTNMSSASDFYGAIGDISTSTIKIPLPFLPMFPDGGDLDLGMVANLNHVFVILRGAADKGAEAKTPSVNGEVGAVIPFHDLVAPVTDTESWVKGVVGDVKDVFGSSSKSSSQSNDKDSDGDKSAKSSGKSKSAKTDSDDGDSGTN